MHPVVRGEGAEGAEGISPSCSPVPPRSHSRGVTEPDFPCSPSWGQLTCTTPIRDSFAVRSRQGAGPTLPSVAAGEEQRASSSTLMTLWAPFLTLPHSHLGANSLTPLPRRPASLCCLDWLSPVLSLVRGENSPPEYCHQQGTGPGLHSPRDGP